MGQGFGRKGLGEPRAQDRLFGGSTPFDRFFAALSSERDLDKAGFSDLYRQSRALHDLTAEERGDLLADLADRPGLHDGNRDGASPRAKAAYHAHCCIYSQPVEVRAEHIGGLVKLLLGDERLRKQRYAQTSFDTLLTLIGSAIKQGGYLSSRDCEALSAMAAEIRGGNSSYRKADTKKMIARAEKLEKLAGVEVSATEFLLQRCEGAENPWAIEECERLNAQFWADLLAEVTVALEDIRRQTKGGAKAAWMRDGAAFAAAWPTVGDVAPRFAAWQDGGTALASLSQHNGKRTGFADPAAYRRLPGMIELAQAHSRYMWNSDQIPGLDVLADLENSDWTALVETLITQRRATRATAAWQKEALASCAPLGLELVEARLHDWLALFHTPALDKATYSDLCNGDRFAVAIDQLEAQHPDWPVRHADSVAALGRAVAMVLASEAQHGLCSALHTQLIRTDDYVYKNTRATEGVLGLRKPVYRRADGRSTYESRATWMRVSVQNEEFLRGAVWLVALMPDRARAIDALAKVAQTAATYMCAGDEGMRSKIVANAAIATLIAMGGSDIDQAVLRLSKVIENCTINPPLFKHLNAGA
ncbi:hypothetical protein CVN68_19095 [Sphingomonas psychrotolerans]|uniref:Uncharacterized protein n=1 Tax=Sphingomonas psychrotolerans TaxID=1327635 RepID=A0A2K8MIW5_9SPHN|nr:hypothetical protein CVN68_19095 [Sphingomonas psychrotolerans]